MIDLKDYQFIDSRMIMDGLKVYIPYIQENGLNSDIIQAILKEHQPIKNQVLILKERYDASKKGVPILDRKINNSEGLASEVNNKLNNAYASDIVDTENGYLLGNPINYAIKNDKVRLPDSLNTQIENLRIRDNLPDKDATLGKRSSICGYSGRLAYIDIENDKPIPRIANLNPEECIFLYNETMSEPTFSIQYYDTFIVNEKGEKNPVTILDFYDANTIQTWVKQDGDFVLSEVKETGFLNTCLWGIEKNDELTGAEQKVINLVNAFDRTLSDASNEIEAFRSAILVLSNLNFNGEDLSEIKKNGVAQTLGDGEISYLTKDINDTMIENHLNRLDKQISRFSKTVDFNDESFAGNISGIAIRFKTMALENKSIIAENKMRASLQYQFKVLCGAWSLLGYCDPEDYLQVWFGFTRNLPSNRKEEAEIFNLLYGKVSRKTLLSTLSIVDDIEGEIEDFNKEMELQNNDLPPLEQIQGNN